MILSNRFDALARRTNVAAVNHTLGANITSQDTDMMPLAGCKRWLMD